MNTQKTTLRTRNFKDLKKLLPVASARFGHNGVTVYGKVYNHCIHKGIYKNLTFREFKAYLVRRIREEYNRVNFLNIQNINTTFIHVYGKPLKIRVAISDIIIKIKRMVQETKVTLEEMARSIHQYLGYSCSFFRYEGQREVPVDSDRLLNAYKLVTGRASIVTVEDALYL